MDKINPVPAHRLLFDSWNNQKVLTVSTEHPVVATNNTYPIPTIEALPKETLLPEVICLFLLCNSIGSCSNYPGSENPPEFRDQWNISF